MLELVDEVVDGVDDLLLGVDVGGVAAVRLGVHVLLLGRLAVEQALEEGGLGLEAVLDELAGIAATACNY